MAKKGGIFKRLLLLVILLALLIALFALLGGSKLLKSAGTKTDEIKVDIEKGASRVEKTYEKIKEDLKSEEKKGDRK